MRTLKLVIATTINAPAERIFALLRDLPRYPHMFRYMHDLRVLEQWDGKALAEITEDLFGMATAKVVARFTFEPPKRVTIEQIHGPFVKAVAWFELEPQDQNTTRVVHGAEITADGLMGSLGLLLLSNGKAKARMSEELRAVKREAETQGSIAR